MSEAERRASPAQRFPAAQTPSTCTQALQMPERSQVLGKEAKYAEMTHLINVSITHVLAALRYRTNSALLNVKGPYSSCGSTRAGII
ncbi:hypothetical protein CEXT_501091 [Caerostris extrusa]|uniref:Uncharacterized protein n=1 Tax=Caerostris extrusa TaxID=172846 RepID=A0AAV4QDI4_CAEEX|nr:hypothetical protein CEXT_364861 [Caerostris extrusa]GIZ03218.1 hypothetical protein CEXT_501091 [Caerostris extrusa]